MKKSTFCTIQYMNESFVSKAGYISFGKVSKYWFEHLLNTITTYPLFYHLASTFEALLILNTKRRRWEYRTIYYSFYALLRDAEGDLFSQPGRSPEHMFLNILDSLSTQTISLSCHIFYFLISQNTDNVN